MDKNQQFFDPYNFGTQNPQNSHMPNPDMSNFDMNIANPTMYYEQQYMYYKYVTQVVEYKIKVKEQEKLNKT